MITSQTFLSILSGWIFIHWTISFWHKIKVWTNTYIWNNIWNTVLNVKHVWCFLLSVRSRVKVESWNSVVQVVKFMWKLKTSFQIINCARISTEHFTLSLRYPHRKKAHGFKCDDKGGHSEPTWEYSVSKCFLQKNPMHFLQYETLGHPFGTRPYWCQHCNPREKEQSHSAKHWG
jgi:hypothetical protein